jgi:hypothetical protein
MCRMDERRETGELTAWFHLSLARGHTEPVVAQNGVCSAVRQINLCRIGKQQGSTKYTYMYCLYTYPMYSPVEYRDTPNIWIRGIQA